MSAEWGSFLHTGSVRVRDAKGRAHVQDTRAWRDTSEHGPVRPDLAQAGERHVYTHVKDATILTSRPTTPPPTHVEAPSA